ncbi:MAG: carbohydrate-binding domain-containing protein [Bacillota bacterium]
MKRFKFLLSILLVLACLAGCAAPGADTADPAATANAAQADPSGGSVTETVSSTGIAPLSVSASESDKDVSWDDSDTQIALNGDSIEVTGPGAEADGSVVTIAAAGTYVLSGTLNNGQVVIAATSSDEVHLVLNGAAVTNGTGAAIYASQCDKLILTLVEGTKNTLADGASAFVYADAEKEEPNAALFVKDDLTINGTGGLIVSAGFNNGIGTKDDLLILGGSISVNAANHGLLGKDSVAVLGGSIDISAGGDGIQTSNAEDAALGWIYIEGGALNISAKEDGIQADTALYIAGGTLLVTAGGGASESAPSDAESGSFKGLKAGGSLCVAGGTIAIDSLDDCVHAGGDILISGGALALASGDDGVHTDSNLTVKGGRITVSNSYEGLEGASLDLSGGEISIVSSDDAINAAGGADQSAQGGMFGQDPFAADGAYYINISGGEISFEAGGDGVDSNGTISISGGTVSAFIDSTADNGAIDANGAFTVTGGVIVYGGSGVGSVPGDASTQSYVYVDSGVAAGSEIAVKKDGTTLVSYTAKKTCRYLALCAPGIAGGQSYDVYNNSALLAAITAGVGGGDFMGGGGFGGLPNQENQGGPGGARPGGRA